MIKLLLVSSKQETLNEFWAALQKYSDLELLRTDSGEQALKTAAQSNLDLVVVDEYLGDMTGLEFVGRLVTINPMVNCALTSSLSHDSFHEKSEGLGVMAQLPLDPGQEEAEKLVQRLRRIKNLMA
jgi:DNA-binding NarL/FixJ family response regulator